MNKAVAYADGEYGSVIEMAMKPWAKTVDYKDAKAQAAYRAWSDNQRAARVGIDGLSKFSDINDFSVWAAQQGYDAITINHDAEIVILNRASVYVRKRLFRGDLAKQDMIN